MIEKKVDVECWDCMELDGEGEKPNFKLICLKGRDLYKKEGDRCPDYDWNEVNDRPWYETNE